MRAVVNGLVMIAMAMVLAGTAFADSGKTRVEPRDSECSGHCMSDLVAGTTIVVVRK
jgi:hypothetical protein